MGNLDGVVFDFQLRTKEKVFEFVRGLLQNAKASVSLSAKSIKPSVVVLSPEQHRGTIQLEFETNEAATEFNQTMSPSFFPSFEGEVNGTQVILNSPMQATSKAVEDLMNSCFRKMDGQIHKDTGDLLRINRDPRFMVGSPKEPDCVSRPSMTHLYVISPDALLKSTLILGAPPVDHVGRYGDNELFHWVTRPLPALDDMNEVRASMTKLQAISAVPPIGKAIAPACKELKDFMERALLGNPFDFEIFKNFCDGVMELISRVELNPEEQQQFNEIIASFQPKESAAAV